MQLAFMPVIGIRTTTVSASAVSEAASMDVVFVIDASDSMTYKADPGDPMRDPGQCNPVHNCHPFEEVKDAAKAFVDQLYFPYDRVSIVTFDDSAGLNGHANLGFTGVKADIVAAINNLEVIDPGDCLGLDGMFDGTNGPCRLYQLDALGNMIDADSDGFGDFYLGFDCPIFHSSGNPDTCGTTSIGKGLLFAGNEFAVPATFRQESLWVVILLTDGAANGPSDACPNSTWTNPFCRDNNAATRHCTAGDTSCLAKGGTVDPDNIDADDYARLYADFVSEDQDALIFTIGLGALVRTSIPRVEFDVDTGEPILVSGHTVDCDTLAPNCWGAGEQLLRYAAEAGSGKYYFAPSGDQLREIFLDIAQNLATRLTQ
jgi:hypothetical protein